ncbi:Annexin D4 [Vitis vinifera]|uniref:Annexin D4 n=1 Tax=Vitis vinifera TaxID=29760 RepID=A0A438BTK0_VITVI|nr:Annexin D4 [Vitis vinifera]
MMEVKKDTILVASIKRRKKQTNKEGKTIMSSSDVVAKSFSVSHSGNFSFSLNFDAVVQWTMHPWERDARMARKGFERGRQAYGLLIELACTRSLDELLGARRAYQSLYSESIEEDVASQVDGIERQVSTSI